MEFQFTVLLLLFGLFLWIMGEYFLLDLRAQDESGKLQTLIEEMEARIMANFEALQVAHDALVAGLEIVATEVSETAAAIDALKVEIEDLKGQIGTENPEIQAQIENFAAKFSLLGDRVTAASAALDALQPKPPVEEEEPPSEGGTV